MFLSPLYTSILSTISSGSLGRAVRETAASPLCPLSCPQMGRISKQEACAAIQAAAATVQKGAKPPMRHAGVRYRDNGIH